MANTLNLSTKSSSSRISPPHARIPTLAAADEHPEEMDEFEHHFRAGFALPDAAFSCCKKTTRVTHTLGSVHPPSWAPLATDLPQLLPSLPSYTRAPAPARSPGMLCAEDPPSITSLQHHCWKLFGGKQDKDQSQVRTQY
eukprot:superscaffoldBa00004621_g19193